MPTSADNAGQRSHAPGKVVAWGEYAVLAGAPACVLAVDRFAQARVCSTDQLEISASGFVAPEITSHNLNWTDSPVAALVECILKHWQFPGYPEPLRIQLSSDAFFHNGKKLGLGSSAAVCVSLYHALCKHLSRTPDLEEAMQIHRTFQGGTGSGLDVAAAWMGGAIRFQNQQATPMHWPVELAFRVVFTGHSADTHQHITRFSDWREQGNVQTLNVLCQATELLDNAIDDTHLQHYISALQAFDEQAQLNIYTPQHRALAELAATCDVLYKPCGAGGGDIGMALQFGDGAQQNLEKFTALAAEKHHVLDLNLAPPNPPR